MSKPAFNRLNFAEAAVEVEQHADGGMVLRSPQPLGAIGRCVGEWLEHWSSVAPERVFLAERRNGEWYEVTYGAALAAVRCLGQALVNRQLSPQRPVAILSDNGVDHALLMLAAMPVEVPDPGRVLAADGARFGAALKAVDLKGAEVVVSTNPPDEIRTTAFADLLATQAAAGVDAAFAAVGPDTIAKI